MVGLADKKKQQKGKRNMKALVMKICAHTLAVATLAAAHATFAQDGDIRTGEANGLTWTYQVTSEEQRTARLGDGTTTTIPTKTVGCVIIPSDINGYSITEIGTSAFKACRSVTEVIIPNTIVTIQSHAFDVCRQLAAITIPASVTHIGDQAFASCAQLSSITILGSNVALGSGVFSSCRALTTVYVADDATSSSVLAALGAAGISTSSIKTLATFDANCESFMTKLTPPTTPGGKWQITAFASVADGTADGLTAANVHVLYGREPTSIATDAAARLTTATNAVMVRLEFDAPDDDVRYYKVKFGY